MTEEEIEEFEYAFNDNYALFLTSEDETDKYYYRGKFMGVNFALDVLGYTVMKDGVTVRHLSDSGKSIECDHYKVIEKPIETRERRKRGC